MARFNQRKLFRLSLSFLMLGILLMSTVLVQPAAATEGSAETGAVYVLPVKQTIEQGLENVLKRGFSEAAVSKAGLIVLEINTPGGRVDTAERISELIQGSEIPVVAYIQGNAASAGSYIALSADKIVMKPGSMIGAAALVDGLGNHIEDPKLIAAWKSDMASVAEANGRNPQIAEGMVDTKIEVRMDEIGKVKQQGEIIALTSEEALKTGYADHIASSRQEVIQWMGYGTDDVFEVNKTPLERFAEFLTNPWVQVLLLFLGIAGVVIELLVPGFGVPGIVGIVAFGLYFFGNYAAGFAGYETWLLFIIGLVLLMIEIFVPSYGILGLLGSISLITGVVRAAYDTSHALLSLGIAAAAASVIIVIVAIAFKDRGVWNKFILNENLTADRGYSSVTNRDALTGKTGSSLTPLRPSGTVSIDGERFDVVTEGGFIEANKPIVVIKVEGGRVVVAEVTDSV